MLSRQQHNLDHNLSVFYLPITKQYILTNHRFRDDVYEMGLAIYGEIVHNEFQIYAATVQNNTLPLHALEQILLNKYVEDTYIEPVRLQYKRFYASHDEASTEHAHSFLYIFHNNINAKHYTCPVDAVLKYA